MTLDSAPGAMIDWWQHTARRGGEGNSMAEIIRTYREEMPRARFVGKRYSCPRFTTPDEQGRVILDYGAYLA